jgi:hypothetical protein
VPLDVNAIRPVGDQATTRDRWTATMSFKIRSR